MKQLESFYASWGHPECTPKFDELPLTGRIVDGKAAMFLYATDSTICSFEHAITMRGAPGHTEAIHALVDELTTVARARGFKKIYVYVGNENARARAIATGFTLDNEPQRWQLSKEVK